MKHCMIDLETLDTVDTSYILSIGAVMFTPETVPSQSNPYEINVADGFYQAIKGEQRGRTMSRSTVQWWMEQSAEARAVFTDPNAVSLTHALSAMWAWLNDTKPAFFWANDPDFDVAILKHAFPAMCVVWPGAYNSGRSFRTITHHAYGYTPEGKANVAAWPKRSPHLTHHHALHDAVYEAQVVCEAWNKIGGAA